MSSNETRLVIVVEQQRLYREAMRTAIGAQARVDCRAIHSLDAWPSDVEAGDVDTIVFAAQEAGVDLVEDVRSSRRCPDGPRVVAIASYLDERLAARLADAGAHEILSGESSIDEVVSAIHGTGIASEPTLPSADADRRAAERAEELAITGRQLEVLHLLATGATPKQIARTLDITVGTCRDHLKALRTALGCATSTELLVTASNQGLLPELSRPGRAASSSPPSHDRR